MSGWNPFGRGSENSNQGGNNNQGNQNNNNNSSQNGNNNPGNNNSSTNTEFDLKDIWNDPPASGDNNGNNSNNNGNNNTNNPPNNQNQNQGNNSGNNESALAALGNHLRNAGVDFSLTNEDVQDILAGKDPKTINERFNKSATNMFLRAMLDVKDVMRGEIETAVSQAVEKSTTSYRTDKVLDQLRAGSDWAKDEGTRPIAEAIFGKAMQKGQKPEDAIRTVNRAFEAIVERAAGHQALGNNFRYGNETRQSSQDVNWEELLGAS